MSKADQHREVERRLAERTIDTAQREITRLNAEIGRLINRRSEQEGIIDDARKVLGQ